MPRSSLLALGLLGLAAPRQAAAEDPRSFVNTLGERAIQVLAPSVSPAQRLARFRELFQHRFRRARASASFVLGRYWRTATPQEQQEFLSLFQEYVVRAYSARLGSSAASRSGSPAPRAERRRNRRQQRDRAGERCRSASIGTSSISGGQYKITDVYVAGISMKVTQRDEFAAVIQRSGGRVEGLLAQLRQKLAAG